MSIWISIVLITGCAMCWDIGVVWQKRSADVLPKIAWGRNLPRTLWAFASDKRWMGGLIISGLGWGLFAFALTSTPISLARSLQGSGFVILAVLSIVFLNHKLSRWEWGGVFIVTAGIIALGLSEPAGEHTVTEISSRALCGATGAVITMCLALYSMARWNLGAPWVVAFSAIAGSLLGLGDVFTKAVVVTSSRGWYLLAFGGVGPALVIVYLTGFALLSKAYQHGRAIVVTALSDLCARLVTILVGVFALEEAFPESSLHWGLRLGGLGAILAGSMVLTRFSGEALVSEG